MKTVILLPSRHDCIYNDWAPMILTKNKEFIDCYFESVEDLFKDYEGDLESLKKDWKIEFKFLNDPSIDDIRTGLNKLCEDNGFEIQDEIDWNQVLDQDVPAFDIRFICNDEDFGEVGEMATDAPVSLKMYDLDFEFSRLNNKG